MKLKSTGLRKQVNWLLLFDFALLFYLGKWMVEYAKDYPIFVFIGYLTIIIALIFLYLAMVNIAAIVRLKIRSKQKPPKFDNFFD